MYLASAAQMKYMDEYTINTLGVPSLDLMERASRHIANAAMEHFPKHGTCAVFCGTGNNGGDGVSTAVFLKRWGIRTRAFLCGDRSKMTDDTRAMEDRLKSIGGVLEDFDPENEEIRSFVMAADVIIDALFGTGLHSPLRAPADAAVKLINEAPGFTIAADIPSGVETDTGKILGDAVIADKTVTFTMAKIGQLSIPGYMYCGKLKVVDIGIPADVVNSIEYKTIAAEEGTFSLPRRDRDTHKGDFGKVLIVAGSRGYTGAPVFSADAAVRTGAGLVFLGVPEDIYTIAAVKCNEAMPFPLNSDEGKLDITAEEEISGHLEDCDVCLVGPGLGRSAAVSHIVSSIIETSKIPLVIDADGINAVSENINVLDKAECPVILTPHDGEFARLGGDLSDGDRVNEAKKFAQEHNCIMVLKGHRTITAFPDGEVFINTTGGPGMAKGGSGDVLAGIITSLIGQGLPLKTAVPCAVYIHGAAGDFCAEAFGEYSMTPSDMITALPYIMKKM